jgi:DNA-binding TFAR19-related protein (PDSD5 family)
MLEQIFPRNLKMTHVLPFGEVLDAADQLTQDEQEELIAILHRRLAHAARQRLITDVQAARQEFAEGRCSPAAPDDLMREILK